MALILCPDNKGQSVNIRLCCNKQRNMWPFVELIPVRMRLFRDKYCPALCTTAMCTKGTRMVWIFIDRSLLASAVSEALFCTWAILISIKILSVFCWVLYWLSFLFLTAIGSFSPFFHILSFVAKWSCFENAASFFLSSNFASHFLVSRVFNKNFVVINTPEV